MGQLLSEEKVTKFFLYSELELKNAVGSSEQLSEWLTFPSSAAATQTSMEFS